MIGTLHINELTDTKAILEFSQWPALVLQENEPIGYAYNTTLKELEIERIDINGRSTLLSGSVEKIGSLLPTFEENIDTIARKGASKDAFIRKQAEAYICTMLGKISRKSYTEISQGVTFARLIGEVITAPFAKALSDQYDGFRVYYRPAKDIVCAEL